MSVRTMQATLRSACVTQAESRFRPATTEAVLFELFELLEEFGPLWYTEEQHNRAMAALETVHSESSLQRRSAIG